MPLTENILEFLSDDTKKTDFFFSKRCLSEKKWGERQVPSLGTPAGHNLITSLSEGSPPQFSHTRVCLAEHGRNVSAWLVFPWARAVVSASSPEKRGKSYPRRKGRLAVKALHYPRPVSLSCSANPLPVRHLSGTLCIIPTEANADIHAARCPVSE